MRGMTLLIATILTLGYGFAAQAAMTVDRAETFRRVARIETETLTADANRVWYGGMLAPVTVEATALPGPCARGVKPVSFKERIVL
jgi:capsule polysaccharide export protein KpsC/LpsZ